MFNPGKRPLAELHIASCIARVRPESVDMLVSPIEAITGGPIAAKSYDGKMVILMEGASTGALLDQMDQIRDLPGVLNVEMVYQHAEDESAMKELIT